MKKSLLIAVVACSVLLLAGCGTTKKTDVSPTTGETDTTVTETQSPETATTKSATKDECIELMAYAFKVAQYQAKWDTANMAKWAQKANELEIVYRGEGREYETACNKYLADTQNFYTEVQKRMAELK